MNEFEFKQQQLRALLAAKNLDAVWLQRVSSFAWATCGGAAYINTATTTGAASLFITPHARYLITNNIEAKRLEQEQGLGTQGVDATFIAATRPGARVRAVFQRALEAYAPSGFADEWHLHHQGGATGYEPREDLGNSNSDDVVTLGQAYAWNPSITGVKSEDTILVGETRNEIVTAIPGWQTLRVTIGAEVIERPAILAL